MVGFGGVLQGGLRGFGLPSPPGGLRGYGLPTPPGLSPRSWTPDALGLVFLPGVLAQEAGRATAHEAGSGRWNWLGCGPAAGCRHPNPEGRGTQRLSRQLR